MTHRPTVHHSIHWLGIKLLLLLFACPSVAATYLLPAASEHVIGTLQTTTVGPDETLLDIALQHGLGHDEIIAANPDIDPWLPPKNSNIVLPGQFILPDAPRQGIVINMPELRLYYYPEPSPGKQAVVITYPISIGSEGRHLPMGLSKISEKRVKPAWKVPASILKEHAENGDPLAAIIPTGPDNPLGEYAMRLGTSSYLIHGTNRPYSIGMRVSHGCIRLYPDDIASLFSNVPSGTQVRIINQAFKAGWLANDLYVEAHPPLREEKFAPSTSHTTEMISAVIRASELMLDKTSWDIARLSADQRQGIPVKIMTATALHRATANNHSEPISDTEWWLQAGAFQNIDNAKLVSAQLGTLTPPIKVSLISKNDLCRVMIGPFAGRTEALRVSERIQNHDTHSFLLEGSLLNSSHVCQSNE